MIQQENKTSEVDAMQVEKNKGTPKKKQRGESRTKKRPTGQREKTKQARAKTTKKTRRVEDNVTNAEIHEKNVKSTKEILEFEMERGKVK